MAESLYDIPLQTIDGKPTNLGAFKGKVVLAVNVASACGLTPQYTKLEALYEARKGDGLVIAGFPANEFGQQEPGTNEEIAQFCSTKYNVSFPMFSKIVVKGDGQHPLYQKLTSAIPDAVSASGGDFRARLEGYGIKVGGPGEVLWNFEKFLIGKDGKVVGRFSPDTEPDHPVLTAAIDKALAS